MEARIFYGRIVGSTTGWITIRATHEYVAHLRFMKERATHGQDFEIRSDLPPGETVRTDTGDCSPFPWQRKD